MDWSSVDWDRTLENLSRLLTSVAIVMGGIWSYLKFVKGQLLVERLVTKISGTIVGKGRERFIVATCRIKNASSSPVNVGKIPIEKGGTGVRVLIPDPDCKTVFFLAPTRAVDGELIGAGGDLPKMFTTEIKWQTLGAFDVFTDSAWLQIGEEREDTLTVALPEGDYPAVRLELWVNTGGVPWKAVEVVSTATNSIKPSGNSMVAEQLGNETA